MIAKENRSLIGAILKNERIGQNRSQRDICYGICVPSYLSKIENGEVKPDEEILEKLYKRLNIEYLGDGERYRYLKEKIEQFFFNLEYFLDCEEIYKELCSYDRQLSSSKLAIDWLIIRKIKNQDVQKSLSALKHNMTLKQQAYYRICDMESENTAEKVAAQENAANVLNNSFAYNCLCMTYLMTGQYAKIHQLESRIVSMAIEEGNTRQLAEYFLLNGTAYGCVNMEELMMANYKKTILLLQNTNWKDDLSGIYYNIGATYISSEKYDLALEYLMKADATPGGSGFFTHQKIAITYIRMGEKEKAEKFLASMKKHISDAGQKDSLESLMYEEVMWECKEGFLEDPEYLVLLEKLVKKIKKEKHFGYLYFYHDVITEAYKNQRQYKKALEFQNEISIIR